MDYCDHITWHIYFDINCYEGGCVLFILNVMMLYVEERADKNSGGFESGLIVMMLYMEEGAYGNSGGCKDGVIIMMLYIEEGVEVNFGGCEDGANYSGYKLYMGRS